MLVRQVGIGQGKVRELRSDRSTEMHCFRRIVRVYGTRRLGILLGVSCLKDLKLVLSPKSVILCVYLECESLCFCVGVFAHRRNIYCHSFSTFVTTVD